MRIFLFTILALIGLNACSLSFSQSNPDAIKNERALKLYIEAQEEAAKGSVGYKKAIDLLNKADEIEPQNAIILHERGLIKIDSKLDVDGGFEDLQRSIDYSKDEAGKQMRYNNRGLTYMELGEMDKACEDWARAGKDGKHYIKEYCN